MRGSIERKRTAARFLQMGDAWLRGRERLHKRYLIHVAGFNLGILRWSGPARRGSGPRLAVPGVERRPARSIVCPVLPFRHALVQT